MSDWYKGDRDDEQRRYGSDSRERRAFGGSERWRDQDHRRNEQRSFEDRRNRQDVDRTRFGEADANTPDYGQGQAYSSQGYSQTYRPDERGQDFGAQRYGRDAEQERRSRAYDRETNYGGDYSGRNQEWRRYGQSDFGRGAEPRSGERPHFEGGGAVGVNPPVQRVADGEADRTWRANMGMGEHRGRGPKNYTRSDERIRDDVSDRLADDPWLDATDIELQVKSGEVTLSGTVQSREDKRRAEDLVEQVSGVRHVQNSLRVQGQQTQGGVQQPPPVT